jgi:hypothetical protein
VRWRRSRPPTGFPELTPHLSRDGLTLYFARDLDGTGNFRDLMQSERAALGDAFGAPVAMNGVNDPFWSDLSPSVRADGPELFFGSSRFGGPGQYDIWSATRANTGANFGNLAPVTGIDSPSDDSGLTLMADGLPVIFSSGRAGSRGGRDLWLARRPSLSAAFEVEANLTELNTSSNDTDPPLRGDDGEIVFAADRSGEGLLYGATRSCSP